MLHDDISNSEHQSQGGWRRRYAVVILVMTGIAVLLGAFRLIGTRNVAGPVPDLPRPVESGDLADTPSIASPGYLGPQICADCHRERVAEFMLTRHYHACYQPDVAGMPSGFTPGQGHFQSRDPQIRFEMTKSEAGFLQTAIRSTQNGDDSMPSRIDLGYGSAPSDEVYFTWHGDRLFELPVVWMHSTKEWGASTFNPDSETDFSRPMSVRCLECHTTWFQHVPGTVNQYKRDHFILGVTCERCHGPAQEHVGFHRANPDERTSHSILHPGKLSRELLIEVCTQCHSNAIKHRGPAFSYRPGQLLEDSFKTVGGRHREEDHVANQIQYLRESKCFQKSESMTCITCHSPHHAELSADQNAFSNSHSCLKCHEPAACDNRSRLPVEVQDNCVGCHMPARNKIQVYFDTENDSYVAPVKAYEHRIGIDPIATQHVLLEWHRQQSTDESQSIAEKLSRILQKHWCDEADRLRRDYRHLAAIDAYRQALRLNPTPEIQRQLKDAIADRIAIDRNWILAARQIRQEQFSEAAATLEELLRRKPDLAKAHGKLGMVYATLGRRDRAVEHLEAVSRFDPDDAYGEGMLGWMAYREGHYEVAINCYRRADEIEPYNAKIHFQWGLALMKADSREEAEKRFRQALTIDPRHFEACLCLSQMLQTEGKTGEAISFARRAAKVTERKQPGILLHLAECLGEDKQFADALQVGTEALTIAQQKQPDLVPRIQRRLAEFRMNASSVISGRASPGAPGR